MTPPYVTPPFAARAIIAAVATPGDYESIAGDLQEEFVRRVASTGDVAADRWYWSQVLRSIPALLSYSRSSHRLAANLATASIVVGILIAMLVCNELLGNAISVVYPYRSASGFGTWPFFLSSWSVAAIFGAALAAIVPSHSVRLTLMASGALVTAIAVPIAFGFSAPLRPITWLLLLSAMPSMTAGSAIYHVVRRR